jgi:hypothetical protein
LERNLYQAAFLQVENLLLRYSGADSLFLDLLADAQSLATQQNWRDGREILNAILELSEADSAVEDSEVHSKKSDNSALANIYSSGGLSLSMPNTTPQFQIESGVDYSLQEFEIDFLENDSVLVEELRNPYLNVAYYQPVVIGKQWFLVNHRLRLDNQYFNYNFFVSLERKAGNRVFRLELDENYFHNQTADGANFLDSRLSLFYGNPYDYQNRWYVNLRGRYKSYTEPTTLASNILSVDMTAYYEHLFTATHSAYFFWMPGFYRESQVSGYRYFTNRVAGFYRIWENYNRFLEVGGEATYQTMENVIDEEPYQNAYWSFQPRGQVELPYNKFLGVEARILLESRKYRTADAISPDLTYINLQGMQKFYLGDLSSLGTGYYWEKQTHRVEVASDLGFAEQADFTSHGLALSGEYLSLTGVLFTAEYRLYWRSYPNAEYSVISSFYSNRFVHSLSLFGWIPLTRRWQVQMFANYDNDQDRDNERNDNRNTLLNLGIIYKF